VDDKLNDPPPEPTDQADERSRYRALPPVVPMAATVVAVPVSLPQVFDHPVDPGHVGADGGDGGDG
jgi:hypothetical protein